MVTRYMIVKSLDDGHEIPADIGAKAVHVTVDTIEGKVYENVQDALQQLINTDSTLQNNIQQLVDADNTLQDNIDTEKTDRQTAISTAITKEITDRDNAISNAIAALEKPLYTASADAVAITEGTELNLSEETYKYILIYCEYNGKRMPVYQVLADGASSEIVYHSLTEDGICYIGMNMLVSENTLKISKIFNSNSTAEFKILNIYGCV